MRIGIIVAMDKELKQLQEVFKNSDVLVQKCGIGKVNAALGAQKMINEFHPDCIISTGVAGGIDAELDVMDVVIGKEVCYHDVYCGDNCDPGQVQGLPKFFNGDESLVAVATSLKADVHIIPGLICTGDQFVTNRDELDAIKAKYSQGLAVDMESAAIAQVCHLWGIPFLSFRIISDTPGVKGHFNQYLNFWDTMADKSFAVTKEFLSSI